MIPTVLIHGGGLDGRCWERLLPLLSGPALAIDLPGRGTHPALLDSVGFAECAASVRDDVDAAGFDSVVLVGHSLAGCSMPAMVALMGERVAGLVFVACTVPEDGHSAFDTLDPDIQAMIREADEPLEPRPMDPAIAKVVLGNDLDEEQFAWCVERLVPEAPRLTMDPVDLSPLRTPTPCTWVRTLQDLIVPADKQLRFADNVGDCSVVDIDAGHMCMVGQPVALAAILNDLAA
jgi:pimeloyl-ACP methyl ester carboxylesterase